MPENGCNYNTILKFYAIWNVVVIAKEAAWALSEHMDINFRNEQEPATENVAGSSSYIVQFDGSFINLRKSLSDNGFEK